MCVSAPDYETAFPKEGAVEDNNAFPCIVVIMLLHLFHIMPFSRKSVSTYSTVYYTVHASIVCAYSTGYALNKWPYLQVGRKACHHKEGWNAMDSNRDKSAHFWTVSKPSMVLHWVVHMKSDGSCCVKTLSEKLNIAYFLTSSTPGQVDVVVRFGKLQKNVWYTPPPQIHQVRGKGSSEKHMFEVLVTVAAGLAQCPSPQPPPSALSGGTRGISIAVRRFWHWIGAECDNFPNRTVAHITQQLTRCAKVRQ